MPQHAQGSDPTELSSQFAGDNANRVINAVAAMPQAGKHDVNVKTLSAELLNQVVSESSICEYATPYSIPMPFRFHEQHIFIKSRIHAG
jgi:hypothetical protein